MSSYDRWKLASPPERKFPEGVEDAIGTIIMWPEGPDEDTLVPEFAEVIDFEEEDGHVDLEVVNLYREQPGLSRDKTWICFDELDQHAVPAELVPIIKALQDARRAEAKAKGLRNKYENMRRQAGYAAVAERRNGEAHDHCR